jgi:hypothetical protein
MWWRPPGWWVLYRLVMRIAHRWHWCYMQPCPQIEVDWQTFWCHWCGARHRKYVGKPTITLEDA